MLVRLKEQPGPGPHKVGWLFTWDAVYTEEHWRENQLGTVKDVTAARTSIARLRQIAAQEHANVIFGHDIVQWNSLVGSHAEEHVLVAHAR